MKSKKRNNRKILVVTVVIVLAFAIGLRIGVITAQTAGVSHMFSQIIGTANDAQTPDNHTHSPGTIDPEDIKGTAWTSQNDGEDSGLDGDALDGYNVFWTTKSGNPALCRGAECTTEPTLCQNMGFTSVPPAPGYPLDCNQQNKNLCASACQNLNEVACDGDVLPDPCTGGNTIGYINGDCLYCSDDCGGGQPCCSCQCIPGTYQLEVGIAPKCVQLTEPF